MTPWSQGTNNKKHGSYSSSITFFLKGRLLSHVLFGFWGPMEQCIKSIAYKTNVEFQIPHLLSPITAAPDSVRYLILLP